MSNELMLPAESRADLGKGASRRLRRLADKVPAIIFGGDKAPEPIMLEHRHLIKALENEAFYSQVITLDINGSKQKAIMKDLQRHPAKAQILHADFQRVSADQKITVKVPLHFINEETCIGVKLEGGAISHQMTDVEVSCLPNALPEYLEVDMAEIKLGTIVHLSDIKLPDGVEVVALAHGSDNDQPIASVQTVRVQTEPEEEETPEAEDKEEPTEGES